MTNHWECKDGTVLKISTMETTHIINCLKMLKKIEWFGSGCICWDVDDYAYDETYYKDLPSYKALRNELINRKIYD